MPSKPKEEESMRYASVELIGESRVARKVDLCLYYFRDYTTNKKKVVRYKRKTPPPRMPTKKMVWDPAAPLFGPWETRRRKTQRLIEQKVQKEFAHVIAKVVHTEIQHDLFAADGITPPTPKEETPVVAPTPPQTVKKVIPLAAHLGVVKYGKKFPAGTNDLTIELYAFRNQLTEEQGGLGAYRHFKNIVDLLWNRKSSSRKFIWSPWAEEMIQHACENKYLAVAGCASCVSGDTKMLDPVSGESPTIKDLCDKNIRPTVMTLNGPVKADVPYLKGRAPLFRFRLSSGETFDCTAEHRLLTPEGWIFAGSASVGASLFGYVPCPPDSNAGSAPEDQTQDAPHYSRTTAGSPAHCSACLHPDDGLLRQARESARSSPPSRGGVRTHNACASAHSGVPWSGSEYTRPCLPTVLSTRSDALQRTLLGSHALPLCDGETSLSRVRPFPQHEPSLQENILPHSCGEATRHSAQQPCKVFVSSLHEAGARSVFSVYNGPSILKSQVRRQLGECCQSSESAPECVGCGTDCMVSGISSYGLKVALVAVESIDQLGEHDYYDLNVPEEHHYFAHGGIHHNSGKSDSYALWAIVSYLAAPTETLVLLTSTTLREARRRVWKSIEEFWMACPGLPGKLVSSLGQIKGMSKDGGFWEGTGLVLVPSEKKSEREAVGKLVGIKQKRVILVADELPELPESIVHAAYSNLSANPYFQMIGLGNPASHFDAFGVFSQPDAGWGSINETDYEWKTARGKCIRFDAELCPNVVEDRIIYPWMPTREKIEQIKADYGAKSLAYYRMVKGFWAPDGISSGIYSEADLVRGLASKRAVWKGTPTPVAGLDPSFTAGGDRTIAFFGFVGQDDNGLPLIEFDDFVSLQEDVSDKRTPRTFQIAQQYINHCQKRGILPRNAGVDATGGGGPFCDALATLWGTDAFVRVHFGGAPSTRPVSATDKTPANERYANRMSEIWYIGQELLRSGQIRNVTPDLAREMVSRQYETRKGGTMKIKVESKTDYKARTGKSPDIADAAFILLDVCRSRFGLVGNERFEVNKDRQGVWNKKMRALDAVFSTGSINLS